MSLNPHRMYFMHRRQSLRFLMSEFSPHEVSLWVNKLNLNFKDTFIPLGLSCISHIHQIEVDDPLLHIATEFWIPTSHVFQFNGIKLCPTIEEFGVIMGECEFGVIILPLEEDLSELTHQLLGIHLSMAKRWSKSKKLNVFMVFKYVPLTRMERSHHLNAFYLCIVARFFLVHETSRVDPRILHVDKNLGSGSLVPIILVEPLDGLDAVHREEENFLVGIPKPNCMIPKFSLPSGIPLIFAWIAFWFSTHRGSLYRL